MRSLLGRGVTPPSAPYDIAGCTAGSSGTIETLDDLRYFRKCGMLDRRSHNLRLVYQGHRHNIPSVSFFNYDLVSDGAWMVSVDIENRVIFWNIWKSLNPWTEVDLRMLARNDPRFSAE